MLPRLASRLRDAPADCDRWQAAAQTDSGQVGAGPGQPYHDKVRFRGDAARFGRVLDLVMRYQMFPPTLLTPSVCSAEGQLARDVTVVQRIFMGPIGLESGIRVTAVFDEVTPDGRRAGFACATLEGHPERGVERFTLTLADGEITFMMEARSSLAALYARLAPPAARFFQHRAVAAALAYVSASTEAA